MITTPLQNTIYLGISLFILLLSVAIIVLGIILIHELPYKIARKRNHPQQDAIRCMAIMGLVLIPLWLLAMVWAYMRSGVSCFGGELDNNEKVFPEDTDGEVDSEPENGSKIDAEIDSENESKPADSNDKVEVEELKNIDSNVIVNKKNDDSVKIKKKDSNVEVKGRRKKSVDIINTNSGK
jgi:hypothetical protein